MIGYEIPLQNTLKGTFLFAKEVAKVNCFQTYLGNYLSYNMRDFTDTDIKEAKEYSTEKAIRMYVHCPLIANLAKDDSVNSFIIVQKELNLMSKCPGSCVLHVGKKGTLKNVSNNINNLRIPTLADRKSLLLETAAGQGTELGASWDDLVELFEPIDFANKVGLCIDTQHLFASGMSNFKDPKSIALLFDQVEAAIGGVPDLVHLNDSKKEYRSMVDRHEKIGQGFIWKKNQDSLKALLLSCNDYDIDIILETPDQVRDIEYLRSNF